MAPKDMIPADEVQALVDAAVAASEKRLAELIASGMQDANPSAPDNAWAEKLAMAFASLSDQGTGRKRVAPEQLAKQTRARERMEELISDAQARGVEPIYTLRQMVFLGEARIQPLWVDSERKSHATEIGWYDIPNQAMEPVNDEAREIYAAFIESIGAIEKPKRAPLRLTAGGLTVRKGGMPAQGGRDVSAPRSPTIRGRGAPTQGVETRILGTLAAPARQAS